MRLADGIWRVVRGALLAIAALILFIEEFGWRPLAAWLGRLARWGPIRYIEERIVRLPARPALALFLVPALLLFPLKVAALGLIQAGHAAAGLAVIVGAKVLGTALVGRLFILLEPQLRQFAWFVRVLEWWIETKDRVRDALRASAVWQRVRAACANGRRWLRAVLR